MAVETVRERCVQALAPAVVEHETKVKAHEEHGNLTAQLEVVTSRLQYWFGLKAGTLPAHLMCLNALDESGAIGKAKAYKESLIAHRELTLPADLSPARHVSKLVGMVKALQVAGLGATHQPWALPPVALMLTSPGFHVCLMLTSPGRCPLWPSCSPALASM